MTVKVNKMSSMIPEFKKKLLDVHERACKEKSKELEREGRRLLNLTLEKRRAQTGFAKARVRIDKKVITTTKGCIVEMHFLVADGTSKKPHRIWHIINRGRKPFTAKDTTRFRTTILPRTSRRKLEVGNYSGKGNWVTIPRGKKYGKIQGREFYKETVKRMKAKVLKKNKFLEVTEFEVNNG